jgi:hypothetical protein
VELPPSPKILVIAPQPQGEERTHAEHHLETLERELSSRNRLVKWGQHLQMATAWEKFTDIAQRFQPAVVYYCGHGVSDGNTTRLVFAAARSRKRVEKPVGDLRAILSSGR